MNNSLSSWKYAVRKVNGISREGVSEWVKDHGVKSSALSLSLVESLSGMALMFSKGSSRGAATACLPVATSAGPDLVFPRESSSVAVVF